MSDLPGIANAATLSSDLSAGVVNITITPDNDYGRTTTRYLPTWQFSKITSSMTATVVDRTILIGGTVSAGNVVGALIDGNAYSYRVIAGNSANLVAANLYSAIQSNLIAVVRGSSITIPGGAAITVRVVCDCPAFYEGRRQEKDLRVILWCSSPMIRDSLAASIDLAVAQNAFLSLPDNTCAHIGYRNSATFDQSQNALLYRRDLIYCAEYPTIVTVDLPSMCSAPLH